MTKLLLLAFSVVSLYAYGQNNNREAIDARIDNDDSVEYVKKIISFIKEVRSRDLADTGFVLSDEPSSLEGLGCIADIREDTAAFTKEELIIIEKRKNPTIKKWSREVFENVRFVNSDTINAILEDTSRGLPFFRSNIGRGFSTFSVPIFLRNDTYCLFYSDHYDAPLAGGGGLGLYRKENGKWKIVKYYCFWIS